MTDTKTLERQLPAGHPALNRKGHLSRRAQQVLSRDLMESRSAGQRNSIYNNEDGFRRLRHYNTNGRVVKYPIRNTELFYRVADMIELFPDSYNQEVWGTATSNPSPCGTAFCIAGHAAHETGFKPVPLIEDGVVNFKLADWENVYHEGIGNDLDAFPVWDVSAVADIEYGLTEKESVVLFAELWQPSGNLTVAEALRELGDGARLSEVTRWWFTDDPHSDPTEDYEYTELVGEERKRGKIRCTGVKP